MSGDLDRADLPASAAAQRDAALSDYRERGVGVLRRLLPGPDVQALITESERLWRMFQHEDARNLRVSIRTEASGKVVLNGLDPVADISDVFASINGHRDLLSLAETGLDTDVTTMKDKLIYKWPGAPGFGLHRDGDYNTPKTGVPGEEVMTVCLALDAMTAANGAIQFFPELRNRKTPSPPEEPRDVDESAIRGLEPFMPELEPGDAILFDGRVPHRSDRNTSDMPRRVYMVSYIPARYPGVRERYYEARVAEQGAERRRLQAL